MTPITLRFLAEPNTVSFSGKVDGGTVMRWINEAAYACATRWAKGHCMTVSMGGARFERPIRVGEMVEVQALLAYTGRTSMNIEVEVRSGDIRTGEMERVTDCLVVFVAVDEEDRPLPVDAWTPETPGDMAVAQRVKAHLEAARALHHGI